MGGPLLFFQLMDHSSNINDSNDLDEAWQETAEDHAASQESENEEDLSAG